MTADTPALQAAAAASWAALPAGLAEARWLVDPAARRAGGGNEGAARPVPHAPPGPRRVPPCG